MLHARPAAVAGLFYPAAPAVLAREVDALLDAVSAEPTPAMPKALIVPHAGYVYSGPVAATAYASLLGAPRSDSAGPGAQGARIRRVVLFGPAHRAYVRGMALPDADALETPLGTVPLDAEAIARVPWVPRSAEAHAKEHSLEVQLPFLLRVLGSFSVVPIAVGDASPAEVARTIEALWGGNETLIVVSSDLSHYLPYAIARSVDARTADAIVALGPGPLNHDQACGATPVNGLLEVARRHNLVPKLLDLRTSGDTAGGRSEVVGYGAFAFFEHRGGNHAV